MWALHARALQCGLGPIVPAGCVVEAWRASKQRSLARLLDGCEIEPLGADAALRAGAIRRNLPGDVGAIDATVVETAIRRRAAVVTSDRSDIDQLGTAARRRLQIIDI
jgi:predicted nucleic acid-binding protein